MKTLHTLFIASFIGISSFSNAQNISTIAGNGTGGYSGDGGQATVAELYNPGWLTCDNAGNIYVADVSNNRIRKINVSTGIITTIAGNGTAGFSGDGGPATAAQLNNPLGIAFDGSGNLYIVDYERVRKVSTNGNISTIAGNGGIGYTGDGGQATNATFYYPQGISVDGSGNIYIADVANYVIRKINTGGIISTFAGNGSYGYSGDGGQATSAQLSQKPYGVYADIFGNVYIADAWNNVIRKVNNSGIISTFAGNGTAGYSGDGGAPTSAELNGPNSIFVDSLGKLYIADRGNNRIREVSSNIISTVAGNGIAGYSGDGGPAISAELHCSNSFIHAGILYIADDANQRIRKVEKVCINYITSNPVKDSLNNGGTATFSISDTGVAISYQWQQNAGLGFANLSNAGIYSGVTTKTLTITPVNLTLNDYLYRCIRDAANSCDDTSGSAKLIVNNNAGIDNISSASFISIYPNPANTQITFQMPLNTGIISIFDVTGRKIQEIATNGNKAVLPLSDYSNGIYLYQMTDKAGNALERGKFCVEK